MKKNRNPMAALLSNPMFKPKITKNKKKDMAEKISKEKIFEVIKHGDQEHQKWLKDKLAEVFND